MEAPTEQVAQESENERLDSTMVEASDVQESAAPSHDAVTPEALAQLPGDNYSIANSEHDAMISIDSESNDDDSAIGDLTLPRSTMSVRSSVYDYIEENGRTYHRYKEGSYVMPNDEREQERLDMQHHLWFIALHDQLHLAPINPNPQNVLDMGTGTGIWAIDFAMRYPSAQVIGSDLSPIQPEFVPPNCSFEVEDVEDEWTYSQKFDLIHGRLLVSCFRNHRGVLEQAFKHLAPGGWLEMQDADFPMKAVDNSLVGTALWEWNMCIVNGAEKAGRPWTNTRMYKHWMEEIGFVDVKEELLIFPVNTWPRDPHLKKVGLWFQHDLLEGLNSTRAILTRGLGWSNEKVELFLVDVRKAINDRHIHAYTVMHVTYGKKPDDHREG